MLQEDLDLRSSLGGIGDGGGRAARRFSSGYIDGAPRRRLPWRPGILHIDVHSSTALLPGVQRRAAGCRSGGRSLRGISDSGGKLQLRPDRRRPRRRSPRGPGLQSAQRIQQTTPEEIF